MNIIETIVFAAISVAIFVGVLSGIYYMLYKVFGIKITTRTNYSRALETNRIAHKQNIEVLKEFDAITIKEAKDNLSKKYFAHTSDNLVEEIHNIQTKKANKNEFIPNLSNENSYEILGLIFKDAFYCCYYNGVTTYLNFINENEGYLAVTQGEPKPLSLNRWFNESNKNVIKFKYRYYNNGMIRFSTFHTGKKYTYDIISTQPDYLNVTRYSPYSSNLINLNFVVCL